MSITVNPKLTSPEDMISQMEASQARAMANQMKINDASMRFNSAMAALDSEKKAWDKIHG